MRCLGLTSSLTLKGKCQLQPLLRTSETHIDRDFGNLLDFRDLRDLRDGRDGRDGRDRNLPDWNDCRGDERDGDRAGLAIVGHGGAETIDGVRRVGDGPQPAVRVHHAVGAGHHVAVPALLAGLGVPSGHIVDGVTEGILRAGLRAQHSLHSLHGHRMSGEGVGGDGREGVGGHVEGGGGEAGQVTEGVNRVERVEGVGRDGRNMVEGGVKGDSVDSAGTVEAGHCREGSEGLERQEGVEGVVSEDSPSHELGGSRQAGGSHGKHQQGLNNTQLRHCSSITFT